MSIKIEELTINQSDQMITATEEICTALDKLDDKGVIRGLYAGFNVEVMDFTYCGTPIGNGKKKTKKIGKELLITNFEQDSLFA